MGYLFANPRTEQVREARESLRKAFVELRRLGYFCRMNFWCCQSCAWYDVGQKGKEGKVVFWHNQDDERFREDGELYLAWSGDADEIFNVLTKHCLNVTKPENEHTRFLVKA